MHYYMGRVEGVPQYFGLFTDKLLDSFGVRTLNVSVAEFVNIDEGYSLVYMATWCLFPVGVDRGDCFDIIESWGDLYCVSRSIVRYTPSGAGVGA